MTCMENTKKKIRKSDNMFTKALNKIGNKEVERKPKIGNAPDAVAGIPYLGMRALSENSEPFTIEKIIVRNKVKEQNGEIVLSKEGDPFVEPLVYITFVLEADSNLYFTMTRSNLIVRQLEGIVGERFYTKGVGDFEIKGDFEGEFVCIDTEPVLYKNGKTYEVPVIINA